MEDEMDIETLRFRERALALRMRQLRAELPMDGEISIRELSEALGIPASSIHHIERVALLKVKRACLQLGIRP